ncbi:MAG: S8 family serine peptidase [Bacteroidales bacterium]|jgi:hypothetical protein|nr:S8 family serine peptidase [Bacteroidales bacterium]
MKKIIFFFLLLFNVLQIFSQIASNTYFIEFTDKNNSGFSLNNPEQFLSSKAIERRKKQNINLNYHDLPVSKIYIDSIKNLGIKIKNTSKWLNGITVYSEDSVLIKSINGLSFVKNVVIESELREETVINPPKDMTFDYKHLPVRILKPKKTKDFYNYGKSKDQIYMNNGNFLHNTGFRGKNMLIAVIDNGFSGVDKHNSFENLRKDNRILASHNFANCNDTIFKYGSHGMNCLSILTGKIDGELIGSAPEANYALLISEDAKHEILLEEYNWVSAAEFADSVGADIISTSLGYFIFDNPKNNHIYSDLDGNHSVISKAAKIASAKGIVVLIAAGNSAMSKTNPWITVPADADSLLTVGAINHDGTYAYFSSIGYSSDGRVKPDVSAIGVNVAHQSVFNKIVFGNGTSFSTPILAGLTACLWQKFPEKTNFEIMDAIKKSSCNYFNPTNTCGYGIPDFEIASVLLESKILDKNITVENILFDDDSKFSVEGNVNDKINIIIKNSDGKTVIKEKNIFKDLLEINGIIRYDIKLKNCKSGIYIVQVTINKQKTNFKIVKY